MPIYEYRCSSCGTELEKLQKISDPPMVECPECGKPTLVKLISASSFRLKGSGWYETDFKTGNKKNGAAGNDAEQNIGSGNDKSSDKTGTADADSRSSREGQKGSDTPATKEPAKVSGKDGGDAASSGKTGGADSKTAKSSGKTADSAAGTSSSKRTPD